MAKKKEVTLASLKKDLSERYLNGDESVLPQLIQILNGEESQDKIASVRDAIDEARIAIDFTLKRFVKMYDEATTHF